LVRHRPRHGWPLSGITAWELLVSVNVVKPSEFPNVRRRIGLAYELSKGRVLEDPRDLMCRELLRIPPPERSRPLQTSMELDVIRRANSLEQLLKRAVPYKGKPIGLISGTSYLDEQNAYKLKMAVTSEGDGHCGLSWLGGPFSEKRQTSTPGAEKGVRQDVKCPTCSCMIPPSETIRLDFERMRCPKCGKGFHSARTRRIGVLPLRALENGRARWHNCESELR
jgi:hypothetical protein